MFKFVFRRLPGSAGKIQYTAMSFDSLDKVGDIVIFLKNGQNLVLSKKFRTIFVQLCQPGSRPVVWSAWKVVLHKQGYKAEMKEQESRTDATRGEKESPETFGRVVDPVGNAASVMFWQLSAS